MISRRGLFARFGIGAAVTAAGIPIPPVKGSQLQHLVAENNKLINEIATLPVQGFKYQRYTGYEPVYLKPDDIIWPRKC